MIRWTTFIFCVFGSGAGAEDFPVDWMNRCLAHVDEQFDSLLEPALEPDGSEEWEVFSAATKLELQCVAAFEWQCRFASDPDQCFDLISENTDLLLSDVIGALPNKYPVDGTPFTRETYERDLKELGDEAPGDNAPENCAAEGVPEQVCELLPKMARLYRARGLLRQVRWDQDGN